MSMGMSCSNQSGPVLPITIQPRFYRPLSSPSPIEYHPSGNTPETGKITPDTGMLTPDTSMLTPDTSMLTPDTGMLTPDTSNAHT